jgi:glyoxylate/hydroxypyruvate reductase A
LTPHLAADSEPEVICRYIWKQIERYRAGKPFENVVDVARGY